MCVCHQYAPANKPRARRRIASFMKIFVVFSMKNSRTIPTNAAAPVGRSWVLRLLKNSLSLSRFVGLDALAVQSDDNDHVLSGSYSFIASAVFAESSPRFF